MSKKYLFFIAIIILGISGIFVAYTMYNKPHKVIAEEPVDYQVSADELFNEFAVNEQAASSKYLDKVILLNGRLKSIGSENTQLPTIIIEGQEAIANCEMSPEASLFHDSDLGKNVSVKGLFIGYDDLLGELQLKKCTIATQTTQD